MKWWNKLKLRQEKKSTAWKKTHAHWNTHMHTLKPPLFFVLLLFSLLLLLLSFVCQSITMHSKCDLLFYYYSLFHPPPPPSYPPSLRGWTVIVVGVSPSPLLSSLFFPTGFARAGPVAGFQGDTLLLAFSDLRQVGLCLHPAPLCSFSFF